MTVLNFVPPTPPEMPFGVRRFKVPTLTVEMYVS